jgi:hypothetical protein
VIGYIREGPVIFVSYIAGTTFGDAVLNWPVPKSVDDVYDLKKAIASAETRPPERALSPEQVVILSMTSLG